MKNGMRALVAMSGGVDSSVAAALMLDLGYEVIGVTLKQWENPDGSLPTAGCCTVGDAEDARRVSAQLGIDYYVLDYVDEFREAVVEPWAQAYLEGSTPNPCVECNRNVRFDALLDKAEVLGCEVLATGHHARISKDAAGFHLLRGKDLTKDQSYVLHMLGQEQLSRIKLPIGEMTKADVWAEAAALGLRTAGKAESMEICFVGKGNYRDFLAEHFPETRQPGVIVNTGGEVLGEHDGTAGFTIGQRRGHGVALGERTYVVDIQPMTSTVVLGRKEDLLAAGCDLNRVSFTAGSHPESRKVEVKIRYRSEPVPATISGSGDTWRVEFDELQSAVAPGQIAVFYEGDEVLGGGVIHRALPPES